jgi:uncharacterized membrane protein YdjX (TVP38/TMEM64 family)
LRLGEVSPFFPFATTIFGRMVNSIEFTRFITMFFIFDTPEKLATAGIGTKHQWLKKQG